MLDKRPQRKSLTDILRGGGNGTDWINDDWKTIPPAPDFGLPLPRGSYITHVIDGTLFNARTGTPGFKVTHEVIEGENTGRRLWQDIWLSAAAKKGAVRDLAKLGITSREQLEQPIPTRRIRCKVFVVVRQADDGTERNEVRSVEVLGIDPPPQNPYAPPDDGPPEADAGNADFPFGANAVPPGPSPEDLQ